MGSGVAEGLQSLLKNHRKVLIQVEETSVTFTNDESTVQALDRFSLDIFEKEFLSIIGPSGCGKTTFLNLLGGLISPTNGRILFQNENRFYSLKSNEEYYGFRIDYTM